MSDSDSRVNHKKKNRCRKISIIAIIIFVIVLAIVGTCLYFFVFKDEMIITEYDELTFNAFEHAFNDGYPKNTTESINECLKLADFLEN